MAFATVGQWREAMPSDVDAPTMAITRTICTESSVSCRAAQEPCCSVMPWHQMSVPKVYPSRDEAVPSERGKACRSTARLGHTSGTPSARHLLRLAFWLP
jgi:hypothetical protein